MVIVVPGTQGGNSLIVSLSTNQYLNANTSFSERNSNESGESTRRLGLKLGLGLELGLELGLGIFELGLRLASLSHDRAL
jgi:hypothetical protein